MSRKKQVLNAGLQEVKNANEKSIDFTTMGLSREHTHIESRWNAQKNCFEEKKVYQTMRSGF